MGLFSRTPSVQFSVANMNCGHCEAKITERVQSMPGVSRVKADSSSKKLEIWYADAAPTAAQVNEALADTDYRVQDC
ncbi:heavy-metal-associated domain-containing protein [Spirochaeta africana]|uniref:Copper chaperone n=1 Tax=Spirochaeta africana (strain ATCC 700263 / DSM 8902 / Z-7692) TaxID=889378 RepID=H9UL31_SPIAZ|nr:heavy metal-associated domain-containing protein [Spirochaeta africana]AFG38224.1 copper chaperone [Spirochaeta africana DSM 8902]